MTSETDPFTSARDLGRTCSGPALAAYLEWVRSEVACNSIDLALFIDPACGRVRLISRAFPVPKELWISGTDTAFRLAQLPHSMIEEGLAALALGFRGLSAREVFARFGMTAPAHHVLRDLELTDDRRFGFGQEEMTHRFIRAFKWDFFRAASRSRAEMFRTLVGAGLRPGMHVALVGMGWTTDLLESCERLLRSLLDVNVYGFCFYLTEADEQRARNARFVFKNFMSQSGQSSRFEGRLPCALDVLEAALLPWAAQALALGDASDQADLSARAEIASQVTAGIGDHAAMLAAKGRLTGSAAPLLDVIGPEKVARARALLRLEDRVPA